MDKTYCKKCENRDGMMCREGREHVPYECVVICTKQSRLTEDGRIITEISPGHTVTYITGGKLPAIAARLQKAETNKPK